MDKRIALIDANNFYCSCERLFQPKFEKVPVVVLSNNDGCFIARSQEAKQMGIKMGQPLFKLEDKSSIKMFSSNYALYGDISDRMMSILKRFSPNVEIYSIDESFVDLSFLKEDEVNLYIENIKNVVYKLIGIPVSIGVGPTKTLAKICSHIAKTITKTGLCNYQDTDKSLIGGLPVDEVWGIGSRYSEKLSELGVFTIGDFVKVNQNLVKKLLTINGLRTQYELNGISCFDIKTSFDAPNMITCSLSFGNRISDKMQLKSSIWTFLSNAHRKLLRKNLFTSEINIYLSNSRYDNDHFVWFKRIPMNESTNDLDLMWSEVFGTFNPPNKLYSSGGVILKNLTQDIQRGLFKKEYNFYEKPSVDVEYWRPKRKFISNSWTTNWDDIPSVKSK